MATVDPIKKIIDEYENTLSLLKKEREEAIENFKKVVHQKKVEDIKLDLKSNAFNSSKK